jgi:AbrB family looped-hinge helix DNA binding protein
MGYEIKVAANGRFVLPLDVRKKLGIERGGSLRVEVGDDGEVVMQTTAQRVRKAQRMAAEALAGFEGSALDAFIADREEQARRENDEEERASRHAA